MTKRTMLLTMVAVVALGLTVMGQGSLSGHASFDVRFDTTGSGVMDALDLDLGLTYSFDEACLTAYALIVLPGTWVWQGFSGGATLGAFSLETNVLFSGYLAEYLYGEVVVGLSMAGIDFAFHAAQLGKAVLGGPHNGWAVRGAGSVGPFDIVSITEFGAHIDRGGIKIVHAPTGRERHYSTDPRAKGEGFTGQKITIGAFPFCCADIDLELYFTCANGFEYVSFGVTDIVIGNLDWLTLGANLKFITEAKELQLLPTLDIGEVLCFTLFSELDFDAGKMAPLKVKGIKIMGLEIACDLGPVTIRDVAVFDPCNIALTTEEYGSQVMSIDDILDLGYEYYPDYWELFSIAYAGPGCCEGESTVLLNSYFDCTTAQLFDLAMIYAEANIPIGKLLTLSFGLRTTFPDKNWLKFGFDVVF